MIKCCDEYIELCDFCRYYNFNGVNGVYVDKGYCNLLKIKKDPIDECSEFHCNLVVVSINFN